MSASAPLKSATALCLAIAAFASTATVAHAQAWPSRSVKIIVPFAPGGSADVFGRSLATRLQAAFGQAFVIENRPGAGSIIGTDAVAKSAPDGYTLLIMSNTHTVNETLTPNKPFQLMRDFEPVAALSNSDLVLVARNTLPHKTLSQIVAAAKAKPEGMTYASSGNGTPYHLAGELLNSLAGVKIIHVPYKGSSGARTDVIGGQVDLMFDAIATMKSQIEGGKVKAIAVTGTSPSPILPGVPTATSSGVSGFQASIWLGVMAPKGTPVEILTRLNGEINKIITSAEVRKAWEAQGTSPIPMSVEQFRKYLNDDISKWAKVVRDARIKAN
jgi:tripartite-type tricarboxylate transporter receptor subunit TctC